jgi:hypothetical protein
MYCFLELLTVVGLMVFLATILFAVATAIILVDEGMRSLVGLFAKLSRPIVAFSTASEKNWKAPISD